MGKIKRKNELSFKEFTEGILAGDRSVLSQAITLIESTLPKHNDLAQKIIEKGYTNVAALKGGWREWFKSKYPVDKK